MSIEELRRQKLDEIRQKYVQGANEELMQRIEIQQQMGQLEKAAKMWMLPEAVSRFGNIKAAHPEKAMQVALLIAQFVQQGRLKQPVSDEQLKELLIYLEERKQINIQRK